MIHFGTGGWRAIIGDEFTKENIQIFACALAQKMKDEKVVVEVPDTRMEDFTTIYLMCLTVVGSGAILYGIYKIKKNKKK